MRALLSTLLLCMMLGGCGREETAVLVNVTLVGFEVPETLSALLFEINREDGALHEEQIFALEDDATSASLTLVPRPKTPRALGVVVYGLQASRIVGQSTAQSFRFKEDEVVELELELCGGDCL